MKYAKTNQLYNRLFSQHGKENNSRIHRLDAFILAVIQGTHECHKYGIVYVLNKRKLSIRAKLNNSIGLK